MSSMKPCLNPQICGVQEHRPGTVCYAERAMKVAQNSQGQGGGANFGSPKSSATSGWASPPATDDDVETLNQKLSEVSAIIDRAEGLDEPLTPEESDLVSDNDQLIEKLKAMGTHRPGRGNSADHAGYNFPKRGGSGYDGEAIYGVGAHYVDHEGKEYVVGCVYHDDFEETMTGGSTLNRLTMKIGTPDQRAEIDQWVEDRNTYDKLMERWGEEA